jgi:hypothetical protein
MGFIGATEQAAEKGSFGVEFDCSGAGAKAPFSFKQLMARLKSCPFAHLRQGGVFPQAVKSCPFAHLRQGGVFPRAVKSCPFKRWTYPPGSGNSGEKAMEKIFISGGFWGLFSTLLWLLR